MASKKTAITILQWTQHTNDLRIFISLKTTIWWRGFWGTIFKICKLFTATLSTRETNKKKITNKKNRSWIFVFGLFFNICLKYLINANQCLNHCSYHKQVITKEMNPIKRSKNNIIIWADLNIDPNIDVCRAVPNL